MWPSCPGVSEDAEHVFFACPRFDLLRSTWAEALTKNTQPEFLIEAMLSSEAVWQATSAFATGVLQELRRLERKRSEIKTRDISTMEEH
ncbi:unnamed protein product [Arctia plantaginis]|uniref:Reverse transcriptase zinc-binding domain-containing protein n=1 Tax=Arctia plantaginis TaxID=874455 RepID=A0A8S0ZXH5_ARCPL|nr:unnamed protein product [Arctia plantaginis]